MRADSEVRTECQLNVECINGVFNDFFGALLRLRWSV